MERCRQFATLVIILILVFAAGCTSKKKKPPLPAQAQAPSLSVPLPDQIVQAAPPPESPQPKQEESAAPPAKPKSQGRHRANSRKPNQPSPTTQSTPAAPNSGVIASARPPANPAAEGPGDVGIAADVTSQQLNQQKQTTAQLIDATEKSLKNLTRTLSHDEEATVNQIRSYIAQSHKATTDGDFERAYNLAVKAQLLSDALSKK